MGRGELHMDSARVSPLLWRTRVDGAGGVHQVSARGQQCRRRVDQPPLLLRRLRPIELGAECRHILNDGQFIFDLLQRRRRGDWPPSLLLRCVS